MKKGCGQILVITPPGCPKEYESMIQKAHDVAYHQMRKPVLELIKTGRKAGMNLDELMMSAAVTGLFTGMLTGECISDIMAATGEGELQ